MDQTRLVFLVPTRDLIGYSTEFLCNDSWLRDHEPYLRSILPLIPGEIGGRLVDPLFRLMLGKATTCSIMSIEERGISLLTQVLRFTKSHQWKLSLKWAWLLISRKQNKWLTFVPLLRTKQRLSKLSYLDSWRIASSWTWWYGSNAWIDSFALAKSQQGRARKRSKQKKKINTRIRARKR